MRYETLSLDHQHLLEDRFHKMQLEVSEYTFANLYLFREIHQFEIVFNQDIYIRGKSRDNHTYLMPTASIENLNMADMLESMQGCDSVPIPEAWKSLFPDDKFQISYLEQESDYLFDIIKMSTFSGRKLSGRRNLLRQFQDLFPAHYSVPLTSANSADALKALEEWQVMAHQEERLTDYSACREALQLLDPLGLSGHLTYINEIPAGFVVGEELNHAIYVVHFARGDDPI